MLVKKLRLERGWSQEQLAEISGINFRTIQDIEQGENNDIESLACLAAAFEIDFNELALLSDEFMTDDEKAGSTHAKNIKSFYVHLIVFLISLPTLITVFNMDLLNNWVVLIAAFWGTSLLLHGVKVFDIFGLGFLLPWKKIL